jgi:hypothetical protein
VIQVAVPVLIGWAASFFLLGYGVHAARERRRMNRVYSRLLAEIREEENIVRVADEPWQDYGDMHQERSA